MVKIDSFFSVFSSSITFSNCLLAMLVVNMFRWIDNFFIQKHSIGAAKISHSFFLVNVYSIIVNQKKNIHCIVKIQFGCNLI